MGKIFIKLLHKHFLRRYKFYKLFNKNTVKLSYGSTKNIASFIASHNRCRENLLWFMWDWF